MKRKILSIVLCLCMMMGLITMMSFITANAASPEFYAVFNTAAEGNKPANTLTFYYDDQKAARNGTKYESIPPEAESAKDWPYDNKRSDIQNVVIDSSAANYDGLKSTAYMFSGFTACRSISGCEYLDVSSVTNMKRMFFSFANSKGMEDFNCVPNVSNWNTANVTDMSYMFCGYAMKSTSLTAVPDVSNWNTCNVTDIDSMFGAYASKSTSLTAVPDVSKWDTGNVKNMNALFSQYASSSKNISSVPDVSEWNTSKVTTMQNTFDGYARNSTNTLQPLDLSGWSIVSLADNTDKVIMYAAKNMFKSYNSSAILDSPIVYAGDWSTTVTSGATAQDMFTGSKLRNAATVTSGVDQWSFANTGATGCFTFKPVKLIVNNSTVADREYDGTVDASATVGTVVGKRDADSVTVIVSSAVFEDKNVGTGKKVVITYSLVGPDADNYIVPDDDIVYAEITKKELTVSSTSIEDKEYDGTKGATVKSAGILQGVITGENVSFTAAAEFNDKNAGTSKDVTVTYTLTGNDAENYTVENGTVTAEITQKILSVAGTTVSGKVYDGTTTSTVDKAGTLTGVIGTDDVHLSATADFDDANAGEDKEVTVIYTLSGNDADNYCLEQTSNSDFMATIVKSSGLKITIDGTAVENGKHSVEFIYDGHVKIVTVSNNLNLGGSCIIDGTPYQGVNEIELILIDTCTHTIVFAVENDNYETATVELKVTVNPREIEVIGTEVADKVYDGTTNAVITSNGILSGAIASDYIGFSASANFANADAGDNKNVTVEYKLIGSQSYNYIVKSSALTADVAKRKITVTPLENQTFSYGSTVYNNNLKIKNMLLSELLGFEGTIEINTKVLGEQEITIGTFHLADKDAFKASNYILEFTSGITATVEPTDMTSVDVEFDAYGIYSGEEITADKITVSISGNTLTEGVDYTVAYHNNVEAGNGTAWFELTGLGYYTGHTVRWFTIEAKDISAFAISEIADQKHTGNPVYVSFNVSDGETELVEGKDYTVSYKNNLFAGTATVVVTGSGNYKGTVTRTFKIVEEKEEVVYDVFDLIRLKKALSGMEVSGGQAEMDVNGDGKVDIFDLIRLQKLIAG